MLLKNCLAGQRRLAVLFKPEKSQCDILFVLNLKRSCFLGIHAGPVDLTAVAPLSLILCVCCSTAFEF